MSDKIYWGVHYSWLYSSEAGHTLVDCDDLTLELRMYSSSNTEKTKREDFAQGEITLYEQFKTADAMMSYTHQLRLQLSTTPGLTQVQSLRKDITSQR